MINFLLAIDVFARAGGGGSSGGGGGGGLGIIALIGYIPSYYLGKFVKKHLERRLELIVSFVTAVIVSVIIFGVAIAITEGIFVFFSILVIVGVWAGWAAAFFSIWDRLKKRAQKVRKKVDAAASQDKIWEKTNLLDHSKSTFVQFQNDWSTFNVNSMSTYLTGHFARHNMLMLRVLQEMHRTNTMQDVTIKEILFSSMHDSQNNAEDSYQVAIKASAKDTLTDTVSNKNLYSTSNEFIEYWTFQRQDENWLLSTIDQSTANPSAYNQSIANFAEKNNLFFSLDMGHLFLPASGVLFSNGRFGTSDINNHSVGMWDNHLIQLYTYRATLESSNILIGQINLPKSYAGIQIRRKTGFFADWKPPKSPNNYKKHTFEWPDFNERYEVSATDQDRLATFELVNPGFMAYLYDTDAGISIEVADNVVYFYKPIKSYKSAAEYERLLTILEKAYKELRL